MFNLSYTRPCDIQGTIEVEKPIMRLGLITDIHGTIWDIHGIYGIEQQQIVQAAPKSHLHPYYTDTSMSSYGLVHQTWKPYKTKVTQKVKPIKE